MVKWWNRTGWIYKNEQGEIYMIRVVDGDNVTEIPVSNSNEKTCRNALENVFGLKPGKIYLIEIPPEG